MGLRHWCAIAALAVPVLLGACADETDRPSTRREADADAAPKPSERPADPTPAPKPSGRPADPTPAPKPPGGSPTDPDDDPAPKPPAPPPAMRSLAGTWFHVQAPYRTITIREDGSLAANLGVSCTGTATLQRGSTYRFDLECGIGTYTADATLSPNGRTLHFVDITNGQTTDYQRR